MIMQFAGKSFDLIVERKTKDIEQGKFLENNFILLRITQDAL